MRPCLIGAATLLVLGAGTAHADFTGSDEPAELEEESDTLVVGTMGIAIGGVVTPGGLRLGADYLYQMSETDWFVAGVQLTGAPDTAACFRDRDDEVICDHGAADGGAIDLRAGVRRYFGGQQGFRPWVQPAAGARLALFPDDDLSGVAVVLEGAAGVRARVTDLLAVGGMAAVDLGAGWFSRGLGPRLQLGLVIGATVDFAIR